MTAKEFKEKHPNLSHLEGDDLWNAMEDDFLSQQSSEQQKPLTDWKGNIIKPGDEVCFVKAKDKNFFGNMSLFIPGKGLVCIDKGQEPDRECWEVGEYSKVDDNICITTVCEGFTFTQSLRMCMKFMDIGCFLLAIKGVSDTKN